MSTLNTRLEKLERTATNGLFAIITAPAGATKAECWPIIESRFPDGTKLEDVRIDLTENEAANELTVIFAGSDAQFSDLLARIARERRRVTDRNQNQEHRQDTGSSATVDRRPT